MASDTHTYCGRRGGGRRWAGWGIAVAVLLTPLIAMQLTEEVDWTGSDFAFAGVMIFGAGLIYELVVRNTRNAAYRGGLGTALAAAFLLIWINAAVGIIGDEDSPANLMYAGVIAVALVGVIVARFRAKGMVRAMIVAAIAQSAIAVVALVIGEWRSALLTMAFTGLWLVSAWLFARAARSPPRVVDEAAISS